MGDFPKVGGHLCKHDHLAFVDKRSFVEEQRKMMKLHVVVQEDFG